MHIQLNSSNPSIIDGIYVHLYKYMIQRGKHIKCRRDNEEVS